MKRKLLSFFLIIIMLTATLSINAGAWETKLFPASVVTVSGEKWGYINESGVFKIQPVYSFARDFNEKGIAIVANGTSEYSVCSVYFINTSGKVVSGPFSAYMPEFRNGFAILTTNNNGSIIIDESGKVVLESKYTLQEYNEGLISFSDKQSKLYGFMDLSGTIVIPSKYLYVGNFVNGKAIVESGKEKYCTIDRTGKILEVLNFYDEFSTSEGLTSYYDDKTKLNGYKSIDGTVVIQPKFYTTRIFEDGYAVVAVETSDYTTKYGLIDKKGNYTIKPEYSGISYLGQGLYAVSQNFYSPDSDYCSPKALYNNKGDKLTDFKYFKINRFNGEYAVACDETSTFFIDKNGKLADKLPKLQGIGDIRYIGNLLQAKLDGGLIYLKDTGEIIWQQDKTIPLGNGISVKEVTYRKDFLTLIQYPQVTGLTNADVQNNINKQLKEDFIGNYEKRKNEQGEDYLEEVTINFSASINKNLITIEKSGYWYPVGAAHGMPSLDYFHIDLKTGVFYQLKDLFLPNSKYEDKLTALVKNQISLNKRIGAVTGETFYFENTDVKVSKDQYFIIGNDSIKLYYTPYEIGPYAVGFPEFEIPYGQISGIINTKGAFWNSFDKKIINHKSKVFWEVENTKLKQIENLMNSYEQNIVTSINNNTFSNVEPYLLKGSNLYNSQKNLVASLYSKNTKEKLIKFEIYAVDKDYDSELYRVFVTEEIGIKYTGKNYVSKKYSWCYTVKPDKDQSLKLSDIAKW